MAAIVASTIGKHLNMQRTVVHFLWQMSLFESLGFKKDYSQWKKAFFRPINGSHEVGRN
jgi:hypothetical protein